MRTYAALGRLIDYPRAETIAHLPDLLAVLEDEGALPVRLRQALARLTTALAAKDPMEAEERYVALFDRTRTLSLHLYEHLHGESRDRGMAMVRLAALYRGHGFEIAARELPDYLPLLLEFLAQIPDSEARGVLAEAAHLIDKLHGALARCASPYAAVPAALLHLAGREPTAVPVESIEDEAGEADVSEADRARMDAEWAEAPVVFGPDGFDPATSAPSGCGRAADMVKRMAAPSGGRRV